MTRPCKDQFDHAGEEKKLARLYTRTENTGAELYPGDYRADRYNIYFSVSRQKRVYRLVFCGFLKRIFEALSNTYIFQTNARACANTTELPRMLMRKKKVGTVVGKAAVFWVFIEPFCTRINRVNLTNKISIS